MISASTAHETDNGSLNDSDSDENDDDDEDQENYWEQDNNRPSLETRFQQMNQLGSNTDSDSGDNARNV